MFQVKQLPFDNKNLPIPHKIKPKKTERIFMKIQDPYIKTSPETTLYNNTVDLIAHHIETLSEISIRKEKEDRYSPTAY
jgi:hypothetical protein